MRTDETGGRVGPAKVRPRRGAAVGLCRPRIRRRIGHVDAWSRFAGGGKRSM